MVVWDFPAGPFATNGYLYSVDGKEGYLIDAPPESYPLICETLRDKNLHLSHLLLTHSHWDHIADAHLFKKAFPDMQVGVHEKDSLNLENPGSDGLPCWLTIQGVKPDFYFKEGDCIGPFQVIETPGHTPGGVCFYDPKEQVLFSGDTLFKSSIGNLSFPTAQPELMWKSLDKLARLPNEVQIFTGHGSKTTREKETWLPRAREIFG